MNIKQSNKIEIRSEQPSDYPEITVVNNEAFGGDAESHLVERVRESSAFVPNLSLVAVEDLQIVGHLLLSPVTVVASKKRVSVLALAPMAVLPGFQRKGIGSAMIREGLERAKASRAKAIVVVGHPNYYPRFGFRLGKSFGLKLPFEAPDEAFLIKELFRDALLRCKGKIEYPSAFSEVI